MNIKSLDHHVISRLQQIFAKNDSVAKLDILSSKFVESELCKLLNIIPEVSEISLCDTEFSESDDIAERLSLHHLKIFKFILCNVKTPKILLKLPTNVLHALRIDNSILKHETLAQIFENQRSLQELEFDPYYVDPSSLNHLKLTKLKLMCNRHVTTILKNQTQLVSLNLSRAHIGDNEFLEVCNLRKLHSLKVWIDRVSWELLEHLSNLQNLRELSLSYDRLEVEYVRNISRIVMPHLQKLKIKFPRLKIKAENFVEMSRNMSNVKHLNISGQSIGVIATLLQSFNNLETLVIGCDSDSSEVVDFPVGHVRHDKLKELCIYSSFADLRNLKCTNTILDIVNNSLKNLEKLKLHNVTSLNHERFDGIFESHPNLTHFFIGCHSDGSEFDEESVKSLKSRGKNLKYFQSRGIAIAVHKKVLERDFCQQFGIMKIKPWKNQIVLRSSQWEHANDD